jgi:hypothetical protein
MNPQQYYGGQMNYAGTSPSRKPNFLRSRRGLLLVGFGILVVLSAGAAAVAELRGGGGGGVAKDFVEATFITYDAKKSFPLLGGRLKAEHTQESWTKQVEAYRKLYASPEFVETVVRKEKVDGGTEKDTFVTYGLSAPNSKSRSTLVVETRTDRDGREALYNFEIIESGEAGR